MTEKITALYRVEIIHGIGSVSEGRKTVATAGAAVRLASDTLCKKVDIQAELDNTGIICVGGSGVVAAAATRKGIALKAGDIYCLEISNLADVYIDATVNGEGVTYTYYSD